MLEQIQKLTVQVVKLQKQLALLQTKNTTKQYLNAEFSYKTKFYTGTYESLYKVSDNGSLIPQADRSIRTGDQLLWNTFLKIAGTSFTNKYISEFRIYNDTRSEVSAFVEEKPDHSWIIGFNREGESIADIYDDQGIIELLLHEYAHIVFFNNEGIEKDFKKEFGTRSNYNSSQFVTEYAATSAVEDMVESFVHFVIHDKPLGSEEKYEKMRFFYEYPKMVTLRQELRKGNLF